MHESHLKSAHFIDRTSRLQGLASITYCVASISQPTPWAAPRPDPGLNPGTENPTLGSVEKRAHNLHAIPVGLPQPIRTYSKSDIKLFKEDHVLSEEIDNMVEWIRDVSLKAELQRWRYEACRLDYLEKERELINTEEWKLQLAHAGTTCRLAGADFEGQLRRGNRGKMDTLITEYKRRRGSSNQKRG